MLLTTHEIKQVKNGYDYKGIEITHSSILAGTFNIKESVTAKNVKYNAEEQGRSFLDTILLKMYQLGYCAAKIQEDNDGTKNLLIELCGSLTARKPLQ